MMKPSEQQQAVLDWVTKGEGSLNLYARAGCGKTSTLMMVIDTIPSNQSVALLAYNKAIAEEIKAKLQGKNRPNASASTLHSIGFSTWKRINPKVQVDDRKVSNIIDEMDKKEDSFHQRNKSSICKLVSIAKQSAFGFGPAVSDTAAWFQLVDHYGINDLTADSHGNEDTVDELVSIAQMVYKKSLSMDSFKIDFDDMILAPLVQNAKVYQKDWVLLDEAQDTNASRLHLAMKLLKPQTGRLIAVGDDRQAIYGFTGADSSAMDHIKEQLNSSVLYLTVTYRCPKSVVAAANALVSDLTAHESAPAGIVRELFIRDEKNKFWFEIEKPAATSVILCRNTKPMIEQAYAMLRNGIGCCVEGREIGEGLIKLATRWKTVRTLGQLSDKLAEYKIEEMQKWLAKGHEERAQAIEDKVETIQVIIDKLINDGKNSLYDFSTFVRSLFGDTKPGEIARVVTFSTIHKSKGREWQTVYFLDKEGTLPSKYARKEWQQLQESNLEYVAITRSKSELVYLVRG